MFPRSHCRVVQNCTPDVSIFNSMIAACAHGGEHQKAQAMFDRMAEHSCKPDAVTFANLIRAYKKGGQWCRALATFEAMQTSGSRPHAAVYSSVIDVLWQTGLPWAQARALQLFESAVKTNCLPAATEASKKGTLKVDLQALTVGVAVLSMDHWLMGLRDTVSRDPALGAYDINRKLAVVNGMGEHSRAQGNSSAVKEAVGASLIGARGPFRLVQDHSRSGRLEASTLPLKKWLFSESFDKYHRMFSSGPATSMRSEVAKLETAEYLEHEQAQADQCHDMLLAIRKYEELHALSPKVLHSNSSGYLQQRKQLVAFTLQVCPASPLAGGQP